MPVSSALSDGSARSGAVRLLAFLFVLGVLGVVSAAAPAVAASAALRCTPGYEYSVSLDGTLTEIAPDGTLRSLGSWRGNSVNGLGVTVGGTRVFALDRASGSTSASAYNRVTVLTYDPSTGTFTRTTDSYASDLNGTIVGGAMDLTTGDLYFGGFETGTHAGLSELRFRIYRYRPSTRVFSLVGYVWTGLPSSAQVNGDLAFDADGNLYVVRGGDNETNLTLVTDDDLVAATGGEIPSQRTTSFTGGLVATNGLDFDSDGNAYLGNSDTVSRFDPTTWRSRGVVTTGLSSSTDLASCLAPPTLTAAVSVDKRNDPGDEFALTLYSGSSAVVTTTSTGSATGEQAEKIGPLPVLAGDTYSVVQTAAGTTDLADYRTSWACTADGTSVSSGTGTTATATVPTSGGASDRGARVLCRFTNVLKPKLTLIKAFDIHYGAPADATVWQLTATQGSSVTTFSSGTPKVLTAGVYALGETSRSGYALSATACVDASGGSVSLAAGNALTLSDGQRVTCTLTSADQPGSVTWRKADDVSGVAVGGAAFTLTAPDGSTTNIADNVGQAGYVGADTDARPGLFRVDHLAWGSYSLAEATAPGGYHLATASPTFSVSASALDAAVGDIGDTRILRFAIEKYSFSDRAQSHPSLLDGAAFELRADDHGRPGATVSNVLREGTEPGRFLLDDITPGSYWLVETAAPSGYAPLIGPIAFTVRHDAAHAEGAIELANTADPLVSYDDASRTLRVWDARVVALPSAGGPGPIVFTGTGVVVLGTAALLWLHARRRRRPASSPHPFPPTPTPIDTQKAEGL